MPFRCLGLETLSMLPLTLSPPLSWDWHACDLAVTMEMGSEMQGRWSNKVEGTWLPEPLKGL